MWYELKKINVGYIRQKSDCSGTFVQNLHFPKLLNRKQILSTPGPTNLLQEIWKCEINFKKMKLKKSWIVRGYFPKSTFFQNYWILSSYSPHPVLCLKFATRFSQKNSVLTLGFDRQAGPCWVYLVGNGYSPVRWCLGIPLTSPTYSSKWWGRLQKQHVCKLR